MLDIFEQDIEGNEDLSSLEDEVEERTSDEHFIYPKHLWKLKLEYSCEGVYASVPQHIKPRLGDYVIIPTRYGNDLALSLGESAKPIGIKQNEIVKVLRIADQRDLQHAKELREREKEAFQVFKEKVQVHKLDMKLISVHFLVGEPKVLFFFSSDNRVDFRELVKDLVAIFKMRIELRQIGVRDESRIVGGLGVCGRPFCCCTVSDRLPSVSIRMAKEQNLSLNSMKISGQCGRLLCCLGYEADWYAEARKKLPMEGIRFFYDGTNFRVTEVNPLSSTMRITGEDGRILEVSASRFVREGGRWKLT